MSKIIIPWNILAIIIGYAPTMHIFLKTKKFFMKKTVSFEATLGVNPGYGHANEKQSTVEVVAKEWQKAAAQVFQEDGIYVGAVVKDSKTVYHTDWGCPEGGEATAEISGVCNPEYTDVNQYKKAVVKTLEICATVLKQSTTQVVFNESGFVYLDFREESK